MLFQIKCSLSQCRVESRAPIEKYGLLLDGKHEPQHRIKHHMMLELRTSVQKNVRDSSYLRS